VPDEEKPDLDKRFRSLLYVAASRARDELVVTWKGSPSALLIGE
jgi:ATP-dependent exoDNAse (exonuclease V) alpha subunit